MENFNSLFTSALRYVLPVIAIIIVGVCVVSLFRNRPRLHKLAALVDKSTGKSTDIDRWETSIGKSRSNDITLPYDDVSRFHAVISKKQSQWVITDTFSKTGVFVNGDKIEASQPIENGDLITIGSSSFTFNCAEALSSNTKTKIRNEAKAMTQNTNIAYAVLVDVITHRPVYLKSKDVLIGRGEQADIKLAFDTVSQEHARIHLTSRGWALSDLNSHNGTKLNGRFINQPQLIFDGDMLTFGEKVFIFYEK